MINLKGYVQWRRGTLAQWQANNEILPAGQAGFVTDTFDLKVGDGVTQFLDLPSIKGAKGDKGDAGADGADGADGSDGEGVPVGGTTGQVLAKASAVNFDTEWVDQTGGGGGSGNLDGGAPDTNFGGTTAIDGGAP